MKPIHCIAAIMMGAAGIASAQIQYNWTDVTPAGGGVATVGTHVLEPNRLVAQGRFQPAGAGTTVYPVLYSDDFGRSWKPPVTFLPEVLLGMFVDVAIPGVVYVNETAVLGSPLPGSQPQGGHLYRSDDFGRTWVVVARAPDGVSLGVFGLDPLDARGLHASYVESYLDFSCGPFCGKTRFIGTTRSHDGGASWSAPSALPTVSNLVGPTPSAPRRLFAGQADANYQSLDGGATWSKWNQGLRWVRPDPLQANVLYAGSTYASLLPGLFYSWLIRTDDGGATWKLIADGAPSFTQFAVDPARPNVVWAAIESGAFHRSEDRGNTWERVPYPAPSTPGLPESITFSPAEPNVVYVIQGSRLFRGNALLPQPVIVEYEYEGDRYWSTSHNGEKVFQDNRQEPGHVHRTGLRWGAWLAGNAPFGAVGSCRFWPKPGSGLRTRVLVLQGPECEFLRGAGWILEAENEFYAVPPVNDVCPPGLVPVHRMPNMKADLNFRWTIDLAVIDSMKARGWIDEGPKFCGRPIGSNE